MIDEKLAAGTQSRQDEISEVPYERQEKADVVNTLAVEGSSRWWSEEEDKRVRRKLDFNVVPWLVVTYIFAFLDRGNIGNANTAGLSKDLKLDNGQYQWLLTIFYIAYILFQVLLIGYKLLPPSKFMGTCVFVWGVAAVLQGAAYNWSGLMAARFFIGMSEAGYGTGVALYLSFFYPRNEIGTRFAWFLVGSTIASAIAGSVAYGLQKAHTAIAAWKLIFLVEGAPTIVLGVLIFFFLPDSISTARFLNPHERRVAEARLYRAAIDRRHNEVDVAQVEAEQPKKKGVVSYITETLNFRNGAEAFKEPLSYISASLLFIINVGYASVPVYLPTILTGMGYTSLRAQGFSAPPYVAAFFVAISLSILADRIHMRGILLCMTMSVAFSGYFILASVDSDHARYGAVWLVVLGLFSSVPLCYMFLVANSSGETKRGFALIMFGAVGQCGPVLGTRLFPTTEKPYYHKAMYINASLLVAAVGITCIGLIYVHVQNKRKDREFAALEAEAANSSDAYEKETGSQDGSSSSTSALRFKRKLDLSNAADLDEDHRRRVDISIHREKSIYYRYSY